MDLGIAGRRAAVAAASRGLGLAAARALVDEGARVAICGRDAGRVEAAAKELGAVAIPCDVSTAAGASAFVGAAREALGGIDILIPNGGGPPTGLAREVDLATLARAVDGSFLQSVAMCQSALPDMRAQGWGRIVAITSVTVRQPLPNMVYSNAARAGLTGYLKTLAGEVASEGITVNSVLPTFHPTERLRSLLGDRLEAASAAQPSGQAGDVAEFGRIVAFLCSTSASYVTGVALPVDGGAVLGLL